jgi:ethanolamine-phosphate cytidylyltransferase
MIPVSLLGRTFTLRQEQTGRFQTIPRTEGVSTTDIGRMLLMTKEHHYHNSQNGRALEEVRYRDASDSMAGSVKFLTTSRMLQLAPDCPAAALEDMRVVYVDGAWDLILGTPPCSR